MWRRAAVVAAALALVSLLVAPGTASSHPRPADRGLILGQYENVVVIFQENHSFDNLYGSWGTVGRDRVEGVSQADAAHRTQVDQQGTPFGCLPQNDVNLTSPPLDASCTDPAHGITSAFTNQPFTIDDYIGPTDTTCPAPPPPRAPEFGVPKGAGLEGGCTRDLVHRFYQEKYQINQGRQNRYVTGSDATGLAMGVYDTTQLPIYQYLHGPDAPHYVIADRFFQGANGGSFLNHQWLISGRAPYVDKDGAIPDGAARAENSIVDSNGMPTKYTYYTPTYETPTQPKVKDAQLTKVCKGGGDENYAQACGNFAVNTVQPASAPRGGGAVMPLIDDAKYPNIGDRLTAKGISWAWYSGGWDDAEAGHPGPLFQYHHQPFNYYADYAPGTPGRAHLQDADHDFLKAAVVGNLPRVSFVKPYGAENEHPGYASASDGSDYLVRLIKAVLDGPQADDTLIVVTYDEFGGQWDHVSPPGKGSSTKGAYDAFGPGTRIPALLLSADMDRSGVDHTVYDTTSIIRSLETSFDLAPVGIRDRRVPDLRRAVEIGDGHRREK